MRRRHPIPLIMMAFVVACGNNARCHASASTCVRHVVRVAMAGGDDVCSLSCAWQAVGLHNEACAAGALWTTSACWSPPIHPQPADVAVVSSGTTVALPADGGGAI